MKRRFTILTAALALLTFLVIPMGMRGQTRENYQGTFSRISNVSDFVTGYYVVTPSQSALTTNKALGNTVDSNKRIAGVNVTISNNQIVNPVNTVVYYITVSTSGSTTTCTFQNVNTGKYMYQASTTSGKGMGFSNDASSITLAGYNGSSPIGFKFTLNGTSNNVFKWNNGSSWYANYSGAYSTSMTPVELYKLESTPSTDPVLSLDPTSIGFGSVAINPSSAYTETFEVSFENLTQNLTVSVGSGLTGVSVNPTTISKTAESPQTVTVSYNPTAEGALNGNITVSNTADNLSETVAVTGSAYDPANIPTYTLVSDAGSLHAGDVIILGCASKNAVAGEMGSNAYFTKVNATFTDGTVATNAAIQITLGGSADAWTLTTSEGQIGVSSANLNHNGEGTTTWTITISNNVAHINGGSNNGDIQYNASSPRFKTYTSTQTSIEIYKLVNENQVATPTFSVEAGTYLSAQSVSINCETDGATIQYKTSENGEWQNYSTPINVSETMTIWAKATKTGMDESEIAIATYTIVIIEHAGTEADPYSVADARNLIDYGESYPQGVYVTGTVSENNYYSQSNHYITYFISADGSTESDQLEAFHGKGINGADFTSADDIQVGDIVVIFGNLTKYNSTYELAEGNQLVSLERPTPTPIINAEDATIAYDAISGEIAYTITNPVDGQNLTATTTADWISNISVANDKVNFTTTVNEGNSDRTATITLSYNGASDKVVTVTQGHYVAPFEGGTYTLATSIESGKTYIIVNQEFSKVMGVQNNNNRAAVDVVIANDTITVSSDAVYEFVIASAGENVYSIYDARTGGYLYAAGSGSGKNYLRTKAELDANGQWTISIGQDGTASIVAQGTNSNNVMQYNSGSTLFSCYSSASQKPVYLYEKVYVKHIGNWHDHGYYIISSPIGTVNPNNVTNMITPPDPNNNENNHNTYDLYRFDQSEELEWRNYRASINEATPNGFDLEFGKGYLYGNTSNSNGVDLVFKGTAYSGDGVVPLTKANSGPGLDFPDWNLVGNPFPVKAYIADKRSFYTMNSDGNEIIAINPEQHIEPMTGVFVVFKEGAQTDAITFTTTKPTQTGESVSLDLRNGNNVIDRAIVRFDQGQQLPKFQLNRNSTKLYIPQDGKDYAVVCSEEMGAMPVNFKAEDNGTYTLNFSCTNVGFAYLHLIDNKTGNDIDLLQTPSYSFEAKTTDYESRFKLVFATGDNSNSDNFAFFSNGSFVINNDGTAELQVIDIMGRIVKSESVNGCTNVNVNAAPGVYMLRLVNGTDVKVQKVVVK